MMNEYVFQQLWAKHALSLNDIFTTEGEQIHIIKPGTLNVDQGADFKNAHIKIGNTEWFGNIELHIRTSDWFRHGHDTDTNYRNIILHVVWKHDVGNFEVCPVLELGMIFKRIQEEMPDPLTHSGLACATVGSRSITEYSDWVDKWVMMRMERKLNHFLTMIDQSKGDIEQVAWVMLVRCYGYKVNADCFEELGRTLPIKILQCHAGDRLSIEAIMLGLAGLIPQYPTDEYSKRLAEHYSALKWKYHLTPLHHRPVFLRMRPSNFPTIRLVQLASMINAHPNIITKLLSIEHYSAITDLFSVELTPYWVDHNMPGKTCRPTPKKTGQDLINAIITNMIMPMRLAIQFRKGVKCLSPDDFHLLKKIDPDNSSIIRLFSDAGIKPVNAFQSQALLELYSQKCSIRDCSECDFIRQQ